MEQILDIGEWTLILVVYLKLEHCKPKISMNMMCEFKKIIEDNSGTSLNYFWQYTRKFKIGPQ